MRWVLISNEESVISNLMSEVDMKDLESYHGKGWL